MSILPQATDFMMMSMPLISGNDAVSAMYDKESVAGGSRAKPLSSYEDDDDEEDY
jgi:hypothetical protein